MQWIRQRMVPQLYGRICLPEQIHLENGSVEIKLVDQSDFRLPSKDTTNLGDLIAAGVDLKRVDSAVYGYQSGTIDTSVPEPHKEETNEEGDK